jgi:hypothetical protein
MKNSRKNNGKKFQILENLVYQEKATFSSGLK